MPTHINIETDFFEEEENYQSENYQRQQSVLFNRQKSAIIMENTLESSRLRRLIWAFRVISRDPAESRIKRKYSSGQMFLQSKSQRKRHRQHTDNGKFESNSRLGFQSRSQSRVLTRKKSQQFHNLHRSESKQSRRAILEGIRQKLHDHNINKSKVNSSRVAHSNSGKKQSNQSHHLDRRIRKLENLMRNIRRDKQIIEPSVVYQKKVIQKMPKKEVHNENFKVFIEEIQKLRQQVSELKQLNQTLVKSSRARSQRSHLTTPRDSGIYANKYSSEVKNNSIGLDIHEAAYNLRQSQGRSHQYNESRKKQTILQIQRPNTPKQFTQNSEYSHKKQQKNEEENKNRTNSYTVLINSIKSPKVPIAGEDINKMLKNQQHRNDVIEKAEKLVQQTSHIKQVEIGKRTQNVEKKQIQNLEQRVVKYQAERNSEKKGRNSEEIGINSYSMQKYSPLSYDLDKKREIKNYDKYLEKDSSVFDYRNVSGYSGNYTPGRGGYTNPQLLKRLGYSAIESNTTFKSLQMIKNTSSEPYPQGNQEKTEQRKSISDELHSYRSSSYVYSQQTFSDIPENQSKKQLQEQTHAQPNKIDERVSFKKIDYPHIAPTISTQKFETLPHPQYQPNIQIQNYPRSNSSAPLSSNPSTASFATYPINPINPIQYQQRNYINYQVPIQRSNNVSNSKPTNYYQKPIINFNRAPQRY